MIIETLNTLVKNAALSAPQKEAIRDQNRSISFAELDNYSNSLANHLIEKGVKKGARVGVFTQRSIEQIIAISAIAKAGGIFVILYPSLLEDQFWHIANDCQIKTVLCANEQSLPTSVLNTIESIEVSLDTLEKTEQSPISEKILGHHISNIIYTSGSTGRPKGVVIPHRNLYRGAEIVANYLNIESEDRLISVLPFNFDYGLNQLMVTLYCHSTIILHDYFMPKDLVNVLRDERITVFAGLRPIFLSLFRGRFALSPEEIDLPDLRLITNTGGKIPLAILELMQKAFHQSDIFLMYGLTEAFRSTFLPPKEIKNHPESIGKAIPGVEILIVDENDNEVGPNKVGELVHCGELISYGYWNAPEATANVFRSHPKFKHQHINQRVVYSGDRVMRDKDGFIQFISRGDELIKSQGHRISPTELEELISSKLSEISQAFVFGYETDDERDTLIIAVVEADPKKVQSKQLLSRLRKDLPAHMRPSTLFVKDSFEKTASGKVNRTAIKAWATDLFVKSN